MDILKNNTKCKRMKTDGTFRLGEILGKDLKRGPEGLSPLARKGIQGGRAPPSDYNKST